MRVLFCAAAFTVIFMTNSYSAEYGYSARNVAMGGAYSAVSGDVNSLNVNPSGIADIKGPEANAGWGKLYGGLSDGSDITQGNLSFVTSLRKYLPGSVGFSWSELKLLDAYSESSFNVTYATSVYKNIYGGITLKYLRKSYSGDEYTAADPLFSGGSAKSAFAADLGSLYRAGNYSFSWVIKNVNQPNMALQGSDKLAMENVFGAAYFVKNSVVDLDLSFSDGKNDVSVGVQNQISGKFYLRTGLNVGSDSRRTANAGLGWDFNNFTIDYAFSLPLGGIEDSGGLHRLSFGLKFFKPQDYASGAEAEKLKKDLENAINALKEMQSGYLLKQGRIAELENRINAQNEVIRSIKENSGRVEKIYVSSSSAKEITGFENKIDALKKDLDSAKKEKDRLRVKMEALEKTIKGKKTSAPAEKTQPAKPEKKIYIVEKGDTLQSIAQKVYGDGSRWLEIYKANQNAVGREGEVQEGQVLVVP